MSAFTTPNGLRVFSQHDISGTGIFARRIGTRRWQLWNWCNGQTSRQTWATMRDARVAYYQDAISWERAS